MKNSKEPKDTDISFIIIVVSLVLILIISIILALYLFSAMLEAPAWILLQPLF